MFTISLDWSDHNYNLLPAFFNLRGNAHEADEQKSGHLPSGLLAGAKCRCAGVVNLTVTFQHQANSAQGAVSAVKSSEILALYYILHKGQSVLSSASMMQFLPDNSYIKMFFYVFLQINLHLNVKCIPDFSYHWLGTFTFSTFCMYPRVRVSDK